jgi:hypothetical protein
MSHNQPQFPLVSDCQIDILNWNMQLSRAGVERTDVPASWEAYYTPRSETIEYINKSSGWSKDIGLWC